MRAFTCFRKRYIGATMILITAPKISAVPTAWAGEMAKNRMRTGAVIDPAPTPVNPTARAMMNPTRYAILDRVYRDLALGVKHLGSKHYQEWFYPLSFRASPAILCLKSGCIPVPYEEASRCSVPVLWLCL